MALFTHEQDSSDLEQLCSERSAPAPRASWTPSRITAVVLGAGCLFACGIAAFTLRADSSAQARTTRQLLEGDDMIDAATSSTMKTMGFRAEHESFVRNTITEGLKDYSKHMEKTSPEAFKRLNEQVVSPGQQARALKAVRSMADSRVQQIGKEIATAVHESKSEGRASVQRRLAEKFGHRMPELQKLRNEIFSGHKGVAHNRILNSFADEDKSAPRKLGATSSSDNVGSELTEADMGDMAEKFEKGLAILASMVEQCRVCLDQVDFVGEAFGHDMKIPYWAKSLVGGLDFVTELSDCVMRSQSNQVKLMMCPMKYASAFSDFMESIDNVMGMSNSNMGMMGGGSSATGSASSATSGWGSSALSGSSSTAAAGWGGAGSSSGWGVTTTASA